MPELDFVISAKHAPDAASEQQHGAPDSHPDSRPERRPDSRPERRGERRLPGRARCGSRAPTPTATTSRKCK